MSKGPDIIDDSYYMRQILYLVVPSSLAVLAVALRFWARKITKMSFESNDYLIVLGLVRHHYREFRLSLNS